MKNYKIYKSMWCGIIIMPIVVVISCTNTTQQISWKKTVELDFAYNYVTDDNRAHIDDLVNNLAPNDLVKIVVHNYNLNHDTYTKVILVQDFFQTLKKLFELTLRGIAHD